MESRSPPKSNDPKRPQAPERLGKYPLLGVIGKGAMGVVYKSFDPDIRRPVALKTIRRDLLDEDGSDMFSARFRNEAQAAGGLLHPRIVAVYEYGEEGDYAYIAMEYVEGSSLRQYFEQKVRFAVPDAVSVMSQLLEALQFAHEKGVWHRDIKPANVLIMNNGTVKVTDFGIARIESSTLTQVGAIMGTPGYIAPELYLSRTSDNRVDLFAGGVVLYQLLVGHAPYGGSTENIMFKVCYETPPAPSVAASDPALAKFDPIMAKALAKNPQERFASAAEFRDALMQTHAHPVSPTVSEETIIRVPVAAARPDASSTAQGSPSAARSSAQRLAAAPANVSTATLAAAGWNLDELARVEKELSRFIGPVAKPLVRRGAESSRDMRGLVQWLGEKLVMASDRQKFIDKIGPVPAAPVIAPTAAGTAEEATVVAPRAAGARRPISAEDQARATQLLTKHMGPIATALVKRAAKPDLDRESFIAALLTHLTDARDRERFRSAMG